LLQNNKTLNNRKLWSANIGDGKCVSNTLKAKKIYVKYKQKEFKECCVLKIKELSVIN